MLLPLPGSLTVLRRTSGGKEWAFTELGVAVVSTGPAILPVSKGAAKSV